MIVRCIQFGAARWFKGTDPIPYILEMIWLDCNSQSLNKSCGLLATYQPIVVSMNMDGLRVAQIYG